MTLAGDSQTDLLSANCHPSTAASTTSANSSPAATTYSTTPSYMMTTQTAINPAALLQFNSSKDSRWLTLEVCREFQRNRCTRTEEECKFAHPPPHVDQQNGRVMCCFDSIKGKCQRKEPPCKYLHPPQHLKEQLLQNGRQNLALKYQYNLLAQNQLAAAQLQASAIMPGMTPMQSAAIPMAAPLANPYLYQYATAATAGLPAATSLAGIGQLPQAAQLPFASVSQALAQIPSSTSGVNTSTTALTGGQKAPRADRLEVCPDFSKDGSCSTGDEECDKAHPPDYVLTEDDLAVVCMDFVKGKCTREHCKYYHPTQKLLAKVNQNRAALAAANQANTHAAQQALSQVLTAAVLQQAPPSQAALLGLAAGGAAPAGQPGSTATAASALTPQVSQASMVAALQGYPTAVSALAGLAGAYQPTGIPSAAVSPNRGLQAAAATVPSQDATAAAFGQAQAKKRHREEELMMSVGGVPGMPMQMKRQALDAKTGIPVFNPAAAYQQLAYAPATAGAGPAYIPVSFAGHPTSMQRF